MHRLAHDPTKTCWRSKVREYDRNAFFLPAHACVVYSLRFSVPRTIDAQLHYCYFLMMTTVGAPISGETKNPVGRHLLECTASTSWFYLPYVIVNRGDSCSPDTLQRSFKVGSRDWWKNVQFSFLLNKLVTPRSVLTCEPTIYYIVRAHRHRGRPTLRYSFFFRLYFVPLVFTYCAVSRTSTPTPLRVPYANPSRTTVYYSRTCWLLASLRYVLCRREKKKTTRVQVDVTSWPILVFLTVHEQIKTVLLLSFSPVSQRPHYRPNVKTDNDTIRSYASANPSTWQQNEYSIFLKLPVLRVYDVSFDGFYGVGVCVRVWGTCDCRFARSFRLHLVGPIEITCRF